MALRIPSNRNIALFLVMTANVAMIACTIFHSHLNAFEEPSAFTKRTGEGLALIQKRAQSRLAARPALNASGPHRAGTAASAPAIVRNKEQASATEFLLGLNTASLRGALNNSRLATIIAADEDDGSNHYWHRVLLQIVFGILYYHLIVQHYPLLVKDTKIPDAARDLQQKGEILSLSDVTCANNFHAFCCTGARAAHTFHSTGVADYWGGCILMSLFPCCTLWAANSFTDLNAKLGGERDGIVKGCVCAMCCSCCMIAKDAQTLDLITGSKTELFSVAPPADSMSNVV